MTHLHIDHIGGAFSGDDPIFPNPKVFISETEIGFWTRPDPDTSELRDVPAELIRLTFPFPCLGYLRTTDHQSMTSSLNAGSGGEKGRRPSLFLRWADKRGPVSNFGLQDGEIFQ